MGRYHEQAADRDPNVYDTYVDALSSLKIKEWTGDSETFNLSVQLTHPLGISDVRGKTAENPLNSKGFSRIEELVIKSLEN